MNRKDVSPRDTPLSAETPNNSNNYNTPKHSPHLTHKQAVIKSNDETRLKPTTHRRQLSDSLTLTKKMDMGLTRNDIGERVGSHGDLSNSGDIDQSIKFNDKSLSSSSGSPIVLSRSHESDSREEELVCALKGTMTSEDVLSVVYSEDIIAKIRGRYYLTLKTIIIFFAL